MPNLQAPPMHEDFAQWYGAVSLEDDDGRRQARWEGVSSVVTNADIPTVHGLFRLAHRTQQGPAAVVHAIREAFQAADAAFRLKGNDRELQILAGACLAVLMETDQHIGPFVALSATTAGFDGARQPDLPMNLAALGELQIVRWGETNRQRPSFAVHLSGEPPRINFDKAVSEIQKDQSSAALSAAFKLAAGVTRQAMKQLAQTQAAAVDAVDKFFHLQDEELQMLWWLTGKRSSDYDCAFDDIPADARPLILAKELATRPHCCPGHLR